MISHVFLALVVSAAAFLTGARYPHTEIRLFCWVVGAAAIVIAIRHWSHG
ncbi:hypothetical protein [Streptomyces sp. NPDC005732]